MSERKSYKSMLNVNIPETENIKLKRRGQHFQRNDGHGCIGEEKKGAAYMEMARQHAGRYEKRLNDKLHD